MGREKERERGRKERERGGEGIKGEEMGRRETERYTRRSSS